MNLVDLINPVLIPWQFVVDELVFIFFDCFALESFHIFDLFSEIVDLILIKVHLIFVVLDLSVRIAAALCHNADLLLQVPV